MFETVSVDNVNSWISGGSGMSVLGFCIWCKVKIKSQCNTITELKKDMKDKADEKALEKMDAKNEKAHEKLFDKIDELPQKIIDLMK